MKLKKLFKNFELERVNLKASVGIAGAEAIVQKD